MDEGIAFSVEFAAARESESGAERRLRRDSEMSEVGSEADIVRTSQCDANDPELPSGRRPTRAGSARSQEQKNDQKSVPP